MYSIKYKLPLVFYPDQYGECVEISTLEEPLSQEEIHNLDGQFDWIDLWCHHNYYRWLNGFNNEDILMECIYDKGNYIITLVSDKPFDTLVQNNHNYYVTNKSETVTLQKAIEIYFNGCIEDGIGENPIGHIRRGFEEYEVWMGDLEEIK